MSADRRATQAQVLERLARMPVNRNAENADAFDAAIAALRAPSPVAPKDDDQGGTSLTEVDAVSVFVPAPQLPHDPIVGHVTFRDGHHEPLRQSEADAIWSEFEKAEALRAEQMPDEQAAIAAMFSAWLRLKELGWKEAEYCPKDGSVFDVIEPGSSGIHRCRYDGQWPTGHWWIIADGDLWPSRPVLFRGSALRSGAVAMTTTRKKSAASRTAPRGEARYRPVSTGNMWAIDRTGAKRPPLALCWTIHQARLICRALNQLQGKRD